MAFKLGSTSVFDTAATAVYSPPSTSIAGLAGNTTGNAGGTALFSDGTLTYWAYPGDTAHVAGSGFRYRSIFTHGFLAGGYKGFNPWRSVNKTWHANDITYYCGEQLDRPSAYDMGLFSDYYGYVMGNDFQTNSTHTSSINLHNGTARTRGRDQFGSSSATFGWGGNDAANTTAGGASAGQDNPVAGTGVNTGVPYGSADPAGTPSADNDARVMDGVGGWEMATAFYNGWGIPNQTGQVGYIGGGTLGASTAFQKFHFGTEIMYTTSSSGVTGTAAAAPGETKGYYSFAGTRKYILYSSDAWTSFTSSCGPDGVCKPMPTKWGFHYWGSGANVTLPQIKLNESTNTDSTMADKVRPYGEENMEMGQDWGYMLGQYDNQQNNHTVKYGYSTDSQTTLGYASRPKGHAGQSSGQCFSAAATITAAYRGDI